MSLHLYFHPLSSFSQKVLIAFYENDTPFTPHILDLGDDATNKKFLEMWPPGWGFGLSVITRRDDIYDVPGRFGWDGGYGTSFYVDPTEEMIGVLMCQRLWDPAFLALNADFWTEAYRAIDD